MFSSTVNQGWFTSTRNVPNIRFVFTLVPNSVFILGRLVSSKRIRIVSLYSAELETSTPTSLSRCQMLRPPDFGRRLDECRGEGHD